MDGSVEQDPARVIVSLEDACLDDARVFEETAAHCVAAGLKVRKRMANIGIISGEIEKRRIADLRAVPHVAAVDDDEKRIKY